MKNALADSASAYLRQHADNPVAWQRWDEPAFELARAEQRLIFLSVGYAACHWCHVMEKESFRDAAVADFLNRHYVPIKVDREEHPDVDALYMDALLAMGTPGGWPLSMWLTPELEPVFGGTYFPTRAKWGSAGFLDTLQALHGEWQRGAEGVRRRGGEAAAELRRRAAAEPLPGLPDVVTLRARAIDHLQESFDARNGGFGWGAKFAQPAILELLLDEARRRSGALSAGRRRQAERARAMLETTLQALDRGGVHDHVGGGFHRYATDPEWAVPHYEKMLYDQGGLLSLLAGSAWLGDGDDDAHARARRLCRRTADYLLSRLQHDDGAFAASEDADSQGEEGAAYTWARGEVERVLDAARAAGDLTQEQVAVFVDRYWVHPEGCLLRRATYASDADAACLTALRDHRGQRPPPELDDKRIVAWNGLAIGGLARAGTLLEDAVLVDAAARAADRILAARKPDDASLPRHLGEASPPGSLEDHAWFAQGLLDLYTARPEPRWLIEADRLAAVIIERFADDERGGLFLSPASAGELLARRKGWLGGDTPAPDAVAADVFLRLASLGAPHGDAERARSVVLAAGSVFAEHPESRPTLLRVIEQLAEAPRQIVVAGPWAQPETQALLSAARSSLPPGAGLAWTDGSEGFVLSEWSLFQDRTVAANGAPRAFVCRAGACLLPVAQPDALLNQLRR